MLEFIKLNDFRAFLNIGNFIAFDPLDLEC